MADFRIRAVEVHSAYAWDFRWIMRVLDFAEKTGLNALVLHRNDVVDQVVFPGVQFGVEEGTCGTIYERYRSAFRKIYRYTPTRRSGPVLRRGYLNRVVREAGRRNIEVYLENKELTFPDVLLELYPSLIKDGHGCPNEPFWWDFLRIKYQELFEDVPGIAGIITSVGTGESRISITSNRCTCDLCRTVTPEQWYGKVIDVMHKTLSARGKRLILRDFVFTRKAHDELLAAFQALPPDIAIAIKDTPHDYYPTFPQNRLIANLQGREKWIEYDTMAQYFGWGIGPSPMLRYMHERMSSGLSHGASGIILRTDWESLDGHTSFDTPNILNLYAGAAFGTDVDTPPDRIYRTWLEDSNAFDEGADESVRSRATSWIAGIFDRNWEVIRRSLYVQDCVFNDCSTFPVGYEQALWLAEEKNSLKDWVPGKSGALSPSPENTAAILAEKDEALSLVRELRREIAAPPPGLRPGFLADLRERYEVFELYVRGFRSLVRLFALVRLAEAVGSAGAEEPALHGASLPDLVSDAVREADDVIEEYGRFSVETSYPSAVYQLLNGERLRSFRDDAVKRYESL